MPSSMTIWLFVFAGLAAALFLFGFVQAVRKGLKLREQKRSQAEVVTLLTRAEKVGQKEVAAGLNSELITENGLVKQLQDAFAEQVALAFISLLICLALLGIWYFTQ